ncbi:MAG: hypothetical protein KC656_19470, partial [Myxococcales bacterium]|nr:hypothetical protein [Myxococcales bacterium]
MWFLIAAALACDSTFSDVASLRAADWSTAANGSLYCVSADLDFGGETIEVTGNISLTYDSLQPVTLSGPHAADGYFHLAAPSAYLDVQGIRFSGTGAGRAFHVEQGGLSLTNSVLSGHGISGNVDGGTILAAIGADRVFLDHVEISGSTTAGDGGAVTVLGGELTVQSSRFVGNTAGTDGGAILAAGTSATIANSAFESNTAGKGGAVSVNAGSLTLTTTVFDENIATSGGGLEADGAGDIEVRSSRFVANAASQKGGAIKVKDATLRIADSVFLDNVGGQDGGAVHHDTAVLDIQRSAFLRNASPVGALYSKKPVFDAVTDPGIVDSVFCRETPETTGTAALVELFQVNDGPFAVRRSLFVDAGSPLPMFLVDTAQQAVELERNLFVGGPTSIHLDATGSLVSTSYNALDGDGTDAHSQGSSSTCDAVEAPATISWTVTDPASVTTWPATPPCTPVALATLVPVDAPLCLSEPVGPVALPDLDGDGAWGAFDCEPQNGAVSMLA